MGPTKKGKQARTRYMIADFTPEEKQQVIQHCARENISVSSFLAGLALDDVRFEHEQGPTEEEVTIKLKISREQNAKLHVFARRQNKTPDQFCQDVLLPALTKGRTSFTTKIESLRYYLSPDEHRLLKKHLKSKNLSARSYVSYLALKALQRRRKK